MLQWEGCTLSFHLCFRGQDWSKLMLVQLTAARVTVLAIWDDFQPAFGMQFIRFIRCMLNGTHFPLTVLRMCNWGTISAPSYFAQVTPTDTCFGNLFSVLFFQNPNNTCLQGERRWQVRQQREEEKEQIRGELLKRHVTENPTEATKSPSSCILHVVYPSPVQVFFSSAGICHLCPSITPAQFTGLFHPRTLMGASLLVLGRLFSNTSMK